MIAADRFQRERQGDVCQAGQIRGSGHHQCTMADRHAVGRNQGEAVLRPERERCDCGLAKRLGAVEDAPVDLGASTSKRDLGDGGHVHEICRPDGPDLGHDGMDPRVQERDEDLRGADARAGASAGQAAQSRSHRGADDARWQWRTHAAGMRRHDPILVARQRFARHALVAHVTQAGIEAVDEIRSIYRSIDHGLAGADPVQGCGRQFDACSGNHLEELFEVRACEGHDAGLSRYAASISTHCTRQSGAVNGVAQ